MHVFTIESPTTTRILTVLAGTCAIAQVKAEREIGDDERLAPIPDASALGRLCRH
ncbi:hypothetical protein [Mesorhizobium japonicum]|uniref:hypothetical protein n=1 Tax=Mesorhizobium japonicum TaxID=2066070 RepID=UPI003B5C430C